MNPSVSVIIPTFNEAGNLPHILYLLDDNYEIIVVDGHSTDNTLGIVKSIKPSAKIITQSRRGKGNALVEGFNAATGDIIVMLDADGSAHPKEIKDFVDALISGADFAKGSRFVEFGGSSDFTPLRKLGNKFLNKVFNVKFNSQYTDLCYGYNAFWSYCLNKIDLESAGDGFEIETYLNAAVTAAGLKVVEVPSFEYPRIHGVSKLRPFRDGFRVLKVIVSFK